MFISIFYAVEKLVILITQLRRNLVQKRNLLQVERLPRYATAYRQAGLFQGGYFKEIYLQVSLGKLLKNA